MTPGEQTRDFYRKQGAEAERERIIKLLARLYPDVDWDLALIKGEK